MTPLDNPKNEPIYSIPPNEREPELTVSHAFLSKVLAGDDRDWGQISMGFDKLHEKGIKGKGVIVAVIDTGCAPNHPDLNERLLRNLGRGFDGSNTWHDSGDHGSHCIGTISASENGKGLIGAAPEASILPIRALGANGGLSSWIAAAIRYAADQGAGIISMSLGSPQPDSQTREAVQYAIAKGCWVVAAAGNAGPNTVNYPGAYPEVICVAAIDRNNLRAGFSSTNREVDIAAPGVGILSTIPQDRYAQFSGTSMATPHVAGGLALVRGEIIRLGLPIPNQAAVMAALKATADDLPPVGTDTGTGAGKMNTARLLERLVATPKPEPQPSPQPKPPLTVRTPELEAAGVASLVITFTR